MILCLFLVVAAVAVGGRGGEGVFWGEYGETQAISLTKTFLKKKLANPSGDGLPAIFQTFELVLLLLSFLQVAMKHKPFSLSRRPFNVSVQTCNGGSGAPVISLTRN